MVNSRKPDQRSALPAPASSTSDRPIRIAVAGAGLIGRKHIAVLRAGAAGATLAGVADPAPQARHEAEAAGYVFHADFEKLLDREKPDGVILAVPNQLHLPMGLLCIQRGIPVLVEKPVAATIEEGLLLVEAAEQAGVATLTGHHRRHNPILRKAAEVIAAGSLGRLVAASSIWLTHKPKGYHDATWRREPGGGPILINAIHEIDCLRMLCGEIDSVMAFASNAVRGFRVEDTVSAALRFTNGMLATLTLSDTASTPWNWEWSSRENPFFPHQGEDSIRIAGTRGCLGVPSLEMGWHEAGAENWGVPLTRQRVPYVPADPYVEQIDNFVQVIRGEAEPRLSGRGGLMTLAATLALVESAETGRAVIVEDLIAAKRAAIAAA
jgi:predicted dehydrogenase